ncbi:MAG TPA: GxxExxY protein [Bacteroidia bacterium]|nr:GxxExxY protein [Bacteroidia bacterium]
MKQTTHFENEIDRLLFREETGKIIGICMEVHRVLGNGFKEMVYKEALENEFLWCDISFEREKAFSINYKGKLLSHYYVADFVINKNIVLEIKAQQGILESHYSQVINYLAVSKCPAGLLINFGGSSLTFKRVALSKNKFHKK